MQVLAAIASDSCFWLWLSLSNHVLATDFVLLTCEQAVAHQPVSVAIEADQREFQLYQGGVFDAPCGTALDHGVLVTGYGTDEDGKEYWIVKNSWGPLWGDQGFIKLAR